MTKEEDKERGDHRDGGDGAQAAEGGASKRHGGVLLLSKARPQTAPRLCAQVRHRLALQRGGDARELVEPRLARRAGRDMPGDAPRLTLWQGAVAPGGERLAADAERARGASFAHHGSSL